MYPFLNKKEAAGLVEDLDSELDSDIVDILTHLNNIGYFSGCMYQMMNTVPELYPANPGDPPVEIDNTGVAADEIGTWQILIPAAILDASGDDAFNLTSMHIDGLIANEAVHYEFRYNGTIVGRGYLLTDGTKFDVDSQKYFRFLPPLRVAGEDLEMRYKSTEADEVLSIGPIEFCHGTPIYSPPS